MRSYQSYLFDLDGTLLDTLDLILVSYRYTFSYILEKYDVKISVSEETLRGNVGIPLRESMEMYLIGNKIDLDDVIEVYKDYQQENWRKYVKVFDGVEETLEELKRMDRKIAIVTSRRLASAKLYCDQLGLGRVIDLYVTPEGVTHPKPHPESAFKAARLLNSEPADCLFVGDSIYDIRCAQAAGMDSALVQWGAATEEEVTKINPSYLIDRFTDLLGD